jgi:hypothetical protein
VALIVFRVLSAVGVLVAAVTVALAGVQGSLAAALAALAALIVCHLSLSAYWVRGGEGGGPPPNQAEILRGAAQLAITTDGIVLGLLTFADRKHLDITTKVGASALAVGVLTGVMLFFLVAYAVPVRRQVAAALLFNLTFWALSFGLLCIVFSFWWG